jgi:hypothetical protein
MSLPDPFSTPIRSFRLLYAAFATDIAFAAKSSRSADVATWALGAIIAARSTNDFSRHIPFDHPNARELVEWCDDLENEDDFSAELESGTFFSTFEKRTVIAGIGRRAGWDRIVRETNIAFAFSLRKIDIMIGSRSEEVLDDLVYEICREKNLYLDGGWPDFRGIAAQIRLLEQQGEALDQA